MTEQNITQDTQKHFPKFAKGDFVKILQDTERPDRIGKIAPIEKVNHYHFPATLYVPEFHRFTYIVRGEYYDAEELERTEIPHYSIPYPPEWGWTPRQFQFSQPVFPNWWRSEDEHGDPPIVQGAAYHWPSSYNPDGFWEYLVDRKGDTHTGDRGNWYEEDELRAEPWPQDDQELED